MPPDRPQVLILDDGELVEVRALLDEMRVFYAEEPEPACAEADKGFALLMTTPGRALELLESGAGPVADGCRLHVVVMAADSGSAPSALDDTSCDLVLRQPLDPTMLRMLVQRAVYDGPDRRRARRVALSVPARVRCGEQEHDAVLVQLSGRGCGLISEFALEEGQAVSVEPAAHVTGGVGVRFPGRVRGAARREGSPGGHYYISIVFGTLEAPERKAVRALMAQAPVELDLPPRCSGAGVVVPVTGQVAPHTPGGASDDAAEQGGERRGATRRRYRRRILGGKDGAACPLIGRDLSEGGMRVEREAALALGDAIKLAIYGGGSSPPVMVKAVVARDDGLAGWFLRFEELPPNSAAALDSLLESLPKLRSQPHDPPRPGVVLSELVERL